MVVWIRLDVSVAGRFSVGFQAEIPRTESVFQSFRATVWGIQSDMLRGRLELPHRRIFGKSFPGPEERVGFRSCWGSDGGIHVDRLVKLSHIVCYD